MVAYLNAILVKCPLLRFLDYGFVHADLVAPKDDTTLLLFENLLKPWIPY